MNNNSSNFNTVLIIIVLILIVGGGIWWYTNYGNKPAPQPQQGVQVNLGNSNPQPQQ